MHYYGTRLSENISRREPEGYLLCLNVPVARTGTQDYLPEELGLSRNLSRRDSALRSSLASVDLSSDKASATGSCQSFAPSSLISVYRPEDEVFSPETVASFEGMPVTNDHPPEGVDVSNIRALQKGHAHNVRRGTGEESDLLLADLIITDPGLIGLILEEGKREISCGYTYELCEENGQYIQRKIRGNHVAVVDAGRAGPRVSIKDHKANVYERSTSNMKKSLSKILARMAKDGNIETVAEIIEEMIEPEAAEAAAEEGTTEVVVVETPKGEEPATASGGNLAGSEVIRNEQAPQCGAATIENAETTIVVDEDTLGGIIERLDRIIELLTPAAADEDPAEEIAEAVEEAIEAAAAEEAEEVLLPEATSAEEISEMVEEILDPVSGVIEDPEETEDECEGQEPEVISTGDALRAALKAVGPALAKMPLKQRRRVSADIAARLNGKGGRKGADAGIYAALASARRRPGANPADLGKRIMANRSANRKR